MKLFKGNKAFARLQGANRQKTEFKPHDGTLLPVGGYTKNAFIEFAL